MVTDEMVEKAANAIAEKRGCAWPGTFDAEEINIGRENMRAALEAALSAAEPVACEYAHDNGDGTYSPTYARWPLPQHIKPHGDMPVKLFYAAPPAPSVVVKATPEALEQFTAYFVKNYPGPDTIIFDPKWHAPKIFRAAASALSAQVQDVAGLVAWRLRHKNDGPHMWEYYQLPEAVSSGNVVTQKLTLKQLLDILNDDKHAGAQERPPEPHSPNVSVPIDLLQKIWAEMYYGVGGEGGIDDSIAQWNLNEVVDILAMAGALPDVDDPAAPAKQEG